MIELVIVIALIGILYSIFITPNTRNTVEKAALETAIKQLRSDIASMRSRAMDSGKMQRIQIPLGANQINLYEESSSADIWIPRSKSLPFIKGVQIDATTLSHQTLIFGHDATPYNDPPEDLPSAINSEIESTQTITLRSGNLTQTLSIEPETGYVYVE